MKLQFSTVRERDMDLLFLQAISSDRDFVKLVVEKTKWAGQAFEIETVALSRTEADLGEYDITVVITIGNEKYGILIEDKIDAIAMPDQHGRYLKRGKKAVKAGLYQDFDCMILCPEKYYRSNEEARRYEHSIFYEELERYFHSQEDPVSQVRMLQIQAAIQRAKKPPSVNLNEAANAFFRNYREYQQAHYPQLSIRTKETSNGWWVHYKTHYGQAFIYHKMQEGYVDLTFPRSADQMDAAAHLAEWLRAHGISGVAAVETGKSAALRILVPPLRVKKPFAETPVNDMEKCFQAIAALHELTDMLAYSHRLNASKHVGKKEKN